MPLERDMSARGRRVLIVEDETRLRDMLTRAITGMEFRAVAAPSAEAALTLLEKDAFDIVLTDLNLPGMQGLDLCERVRQRWPDLQLVILTGYGSLEAAKNAIRMEVADFLTKPTSLGDLEAALNRALRRRLNHITTRPLPAIDLQGEHEGRGRGGTVAVASAGACEKSAVGDDDGSGSASAGGAATGARETTPRRLQDLEREHVLAALARHDGNREATAEELGISVRTLYYRLKEYQQQGHLPPGKT